LRYVHPGKVHVPGVHKPSLMMPNPDQLRSLARYHSFALEHYDKFLQGASRAHLRLMTEDHARLMTMIACLLVVCVENIQYHYQNAVIQCSEGAPGDESAQ
jgi:hypothetical protein